MAEDHEGGAPQLLGEYLETLRPDELAVFNTAQKVWPLEGTSELPVSTGAVWLGPAFAAWPTFLSQQGITHVVCLTQDPSPAQRFAFVKFLHIPVDDEPETDLLSQLAGAVAWISEAVAAGGQVLVHCRAGRSRSATVVAAFIAQRTSCSAEAAVDCVQVARPFVQLNAGFEVQLRSFVASCQAERDASSGSSAAESPEVEAAEVCELCLLKRVTTWLEETDDLVVLLCDQCDNPMVVWRRHTMLLSRRERELMRSALAPHADQALRAGDWYMDTKQRTIDSHIHWHARPHDMLSRHLQALRNEAAKPSRL